MVKPVTVKGKLKTINKHPRWVVINLVKFLPHTELPLPHSYNLRATTSVVFDPVDMHRMHCTDVPGTSSIIDDDEYIPRFKYTVTIATVNEERVFYNRKFIVNIDPGLKGIMIMPHYADPKVGPVNSPTAIKGAKYCLLPTHWHRVPDGLTYDLLIQRSIRHVRWSVCSTTGSGWCHRNLRRWRNLLPIIRTGGWLPGGKVIGEVGGSGSNFR